MKRIIFSLWFMVYGLWPCVYAQDETLTLLTYYPAPYGVYTDLEARNRLTVRGTRMEHSHDDAAIDNSFYWFVGLETGAGTDTFNYPALPTMLLTNAGRLELAAGTGERIIFDSPQDEHARIVFYEDTADIYEFRYDGSGSGVNNLLRFRYLYQTPRDILTMDGNGTVSIAADSSDLEGIKLQANYNNNGTSGRLLFAQSENNLYGFSLLYAGANNPVLGGTAFTLSGGGLYLIRHNNSATGNALMVFSRSNNIVSFEPNVDVLIDYRLFVGANPGYQAKINVDGDIQVIRGTIECDGNSSELITAYLSNNSTNQYPPISAVAGQTNTRYGTGVLGRSEYNGGSPGTYAAGVTAIGNDAYGIYAHSADRDAGYFSGSVNITGALRHNGVSHSGWDIAEWIKSVDTKLEPGDVIVTDTDVRKSTKKSSLPYDKDVLGIISEKPGSCGGYLVSKNGNLYSDKKMFAKGYVKLALAGQVYCKVDASLSEINTGDLLTTSSTPGHAIKAKPIGEINGYPIYPQGCIIGKALEPLKEGQGKILILVCLM